jgi:hypothetical protein
MRGSGATGVGGAEQLLLVKKSCLVEKKLSSEKKLSCHHIMLSCCYLSSAVHYIGEATGFLIWSD